jgi:ferritin-like metal-binding protein YciE
MSKTQTSKKAVLPSNRPATPGKGIPPPENLLDLLESSIKDLYWAENHLVKTLPSIQDAAGSTGLRKAVGDHLKITKGHVTRLEKAFALLGKKPMAKKCDAMEGLTMEGEGIINSTAAGSIARDRGLIMACQKVELYEIASYRGLALLATQLEKPDIAGLLNETLTEELEADQALTVLAEK